MAAVAVFLSFLSLMLVHRGQGDEAGKEEGTPSLNDLEKDMT